MENILTVCLVLLAAYHAHYRFSIYKKRNLNSKFTVKDPANQLRFVSSAYFEKKKIMNKEEYGLFSLVEECARNANRGYRTFAQTSLGEIIRSENQKAFDSINSKRVDILVVNPFGYPALAIEYQGSGHYQGDTAAMRGAVKEEALRRANVPFLPVHYGYDPGLTRSQISAMLQSADCSASPGWGGH